MSALKEDPGRTQGRWTGEGLLSLYSVGCSVSKVRSEEGLK